MATVAMAAVKSSEKKRMSIAGCKTRHQDFMFASVKYINQLITIQQLVLLRRSFVCFL